MTKIFGGKVCPSWCVMDGAHLDRWNTTPTHQAQLALRQGETGGSYAVTLAQPVGSILPPTVTIAHVGMGGGFHGLQLDLADAEWLRDELTAHLERERTDTP